MKIPDTGFCLHILRLRQESRSRRRRTVGNYCGYWDGVAVPGLDGQIVEPAGPGDNSAAGDANDARIAAGSYPLRSHDGGNYKTVGYAAQGAPRPAVALGQTGKRTAILIHPCHASDGFLSSVGCLNAASGLTDGNSRIDLADSRARVIALIDFLANHGGVAGTVVIEGEPV